VITASDDVETERALARRRTARAGLVALVAAGVLAVWLWGRALTEDGADLHLRGGYVLVGGLDPVVPPGVLVPLLVAVACVVWGPSLARRLPWRGLLAGSAGGAAVWAVAVAAGHGWERLAEPMASKHEYVADVDRVRGIGAFLSTFVDSVPVDSADPWVTHVAGHPPGALLSFALLDRVGLGGPGWAAVLCIAGGALAVPAVLVTVRVVSDEAAARRVAPFAVLFPAAVWVATSADAFFAGVTAWGVALLCLGAARGATRTGYASALAGGLLLGLSLFLSFGLTAAGLIALAVVLVQKDRLGWGGVVRVLAVSAVAVLAVFGLFTLGGYWWFEGIVVDAQRVQEGAAYPDRYAVYHYFLAANVAAAAVATGPAVVAGLAGLRGRLLWLPLAALAGMAVSNGSGLVLGETERIWLPFLFWLLPATAALPVLSQRFWLALSALLTVAVEITVRSPW
jgi:methylthioxylose transferase